MSALKDQLRNDLNTALKARDTLRTSVIRMALAAITNAEVAGKEARELTDDEELTVVAKEMRKRRDSAETYAEAGRQELADKETGEAEFIARYLPTPLTHDEIVALVEEAVAGLGEPATMKHMGALVKAVSTKAEGRAEGKEIAALVRAKLQG